MDYTLINKQEVTIEDVDHKLRNRTIPEHKVKQVYQVGILDNLSHDYLIKIVEHTMALERLQDTIDLLSQYL